MVSELATYRPRHALSGICASARRSGSDEINIGTVAPYPSTSINGGIVMFLVKKLIK